MIFTTTDDLRSLERSDYWIADGTFRTAPTLLMQLFTIHGRVGGVDGYVLPLVYVLMTRRTNEMYDAVMRALSEIAEENRISLNPKYVLTDFEIAEMRSFVRELPGTQSKGCLFHLGKSIFRRIQACGLAQRYGTDVPYSLKLKKTVCAGVSSTG